MTNASLSDPPDHCHFFRVHLQIPSGILLREKVSKGSNCSSIPAVIPLAREPSLRLKPLKDYELKTPPLPRDVVRLRLWGEPHCHKHRRAIATNSVVDNEGNAVDGGFAVIGNISDESALTTLSSGAELASLFTLFDGAAGPITAAPFAGTFSVSSQGDVPLNVPNEFSWESDLPRPRQLR